MDEQRGSGARYGVSDEVWRAIEPEARAAAVRERGVLLRTALVTGLVVLLGVGVYWSGVFSPRLSGGDHSSYGSASPGSRGHLEFDLHNDGVLTEHVTRWAIPMPGVELQPVAPQQLDLAPRSMQTVHLEFEVTDCTAAIRAGRTLAREHPVDGPGVRMWASRPWGSAVTTVMPPGSVTDMVLMSCGVDLSKE